MLSFMRDMKVAIIAEQFAVAFSAQNVKALEIQTMKYSYKMKILNSSKSHFLNTRTS